jgi:hypothetical protein
MDMSQISRSRSLMPSTLREAGGHRRRSRLVVAASALILGTSVALTLGSPPTSAAIRPLMAAQVVAGTSGLNAVACSSTTFCVAVGDDSGVPVIVPINDGVPGSTMGIMGYGETGAPTSVRLESVTCPTATLCFAVGTGGIPYTPGLLEGVGVVVAITNGIPGYAQLVEGAGQPGVPDSVNLMGVACSSATSCVAVGDDLYQDGIIVPITNGTPGSEVNAVASELTGVVCRSSGTCIAVGAGLMGGGVVVSIVDGTPELVAGPSGTDGVTGIACHQASYCVGVGANDSGTGVVVAPMTKKNGGTAQVVAGIGGINQVACAGPTYCLAVGGNASHQGVKIRVTNAAPGTARVVSGVSGFNGVTCASIDFCLAVGANASHQGVVDQLQLVPS